MRVRPSFASADRHFVPLDPITRARDAYWLPGNLGFAFRNSFRNS